MSKQELKPLERKQTDWVAVIDQIRKCDRRWNDRTIGKAIGVGHMSIFNLRHGKDDKGIDPLWSTGDALLRLLQREQKAASKRHHQDAGSDS